MKNINAKGSIFFFGSQTLFTMSDLFTIFIGTQRDPNVDKDTYIQ